MMLRRRTERKAKVAASSFLKRVASGQDWSPSSPTIPVKQASKSVKSSKLTKKSFKKDEGQKSPKSAPRQSTPVTPGKHNKSPEQSNLKSTAKSNLLPGRSEGVALRKSSVSPKTLDGKGSQKLTRSRTEGPSHAVVLPKKDDEKTPQRFGALSKNNNETRQKIASSPKKEESIQKTISGSPNKGSQTPQTGTLPKKESRKSSPKVDLTENAVKKSLSYGVRADSMVQELSDCKVALPQGRVVIEGRCDINNIHGDDMPSKHNSVTNSEIKPGLSPEAGNVCHCTSSPRKRKADGELSCVNKLCVKLTKLDEKSLNHVKGIDSSVKSRKQDQNCEFARSVDDAVRGALTQPARATDVLRNKAEHFESIVYPSDRYSKLDFLKGFGLVLKSEVAKLEGSPNKLHREAGGKLRRVLKPRLMPGMVYKKVAITKGLGLNGVSVNPEQSSRQNAPTLVSNGMHSKSNFHAVSKFTLLRSPKSPLKTTGPLVVMKKIPQTASSVAKMTSSVAKMTSSVAKMTSSVAKTTTDRASVEGKGTNVELIESQTKASSDAKSSKASTMEDPKENSGVEDNSKETETTDEKPVKNDVKGVGQKQSKQKCSPRSKTEVKPPPSAATSSSDLDLMARRSTRQQGHKRRVWGHLLRANPDQFEGNDKWEKEVREVPKTSVKKPQKENVSQDLIQKAPIGDTNTCSDSVVSSDNVETKDLGKPKQTSLPFKETNSDEEKSSTIEKRYANASNSQASSTSCESELLPAKNEGSLNLENSTNSSTTATSPQKRKRKKKIKPEANEILPTAVSKETKPDCFRSHLCSSYTLLSYRSKDSDCVAPHMCNVCWVNDHMYCRNMKRTVSDLPAFGGCIHHIPCVHHIFGGFSTLERFYQKKTSSSSYVASNAAVAPSSDESVSSPAERRWNDEDLLCQEEMADSDSESSLPVSSRETDILSIQLRTRADQIVRCLGVDRMPENVNFFVNHDVSEIVDDYDDDTCVVPEDYGAEVMIEDEGDDGCWVEATTESSVASSQTSDNSSIDKWENGSLESGKESGKCLESEDGSRGTSDNVSDDVSASSSSQNLRVIHVQVQKLDADRVRVTYPKVVDGSDSGGVRSGSVLVQKEVKFPSGASEKALNEYLAKEALRMVSGVKVDENRRRKPTLLQVSDAAGSLKCADGVVLAVNEARAETCSAAGKVKKKRYSTEQVPTGMVSQRKKSMREENRIHQKSRGSKMTLPGDQMLSNEAEPLSDKSLGSDVRVVGTSRLDESKVATEASTSLQRSSLMNLQHSDVIVSQGGPPPGTISPSLTEDTNKDVRSLAPLSSAQSGIAATATRCDRLFEFDAGDGPVVGNDRKCQTGDQVTSGRDDHQLPVISENFDVTPVPTSANKRCKAASDKSFKPLEQHSVKCTKNTCTADAFERCDVNASPSESRLEGAVSTPAPDSTSQRLAIGAVLTSVAELDMASIAQVTNNNNTDTFSSAITCMNPPPPTAATSAETCAGIVAPLTVPGAERFVTVSGGIRIARLPVDPNLSCLMVAGNRSAVSLTCNVSSTQVTAKTTSATVAGGTISLPDLPKLVSPNILPKVTVSNVAFGSKNPVDKHKVHLAQTNISSTTAARIDSSQICKNAIICVAPSGGLQTAMRINLNHFLAMGKNVPLVINQAETKSQTSVIQVPRTAAEISCASPSNLIRPLLNPPGSASLLVTSCQVMSGGIIPTTLKPCKLQCSTSDRNDLKTDIALGKNENLALSPTVVSAVPDNTDTAT